MDTIKQVPAEEAARIVLEDILAKPEGADITQRVVERNRGLSLHDSCDPEYVVGSQILNETYGTPLDASLPILLSEFSDKVYVPFGILPVKERFPEEITPENIVDMLCTNFFYLDDTTMINKIGEMSRLKFDKDYTPRNKIVQDDLPEPSPQENPYSNGVDVSSRETVITPQRIGNK